MIEQEDHQIDSPKEDITAAVTQTLATIVRDEIRVQKIQGETKLIWGTITLGELPFIFVAQRRIAPRTLSQIDFASQWWTHRPYIPGTFTAPPFTKPLVPGTHQGDEACYAKVLETFDTDKKQRTIFSVAVSIACDRALKQTDMV